MNHVIRHLGLIALSLGLTACASGQIRHQDPAPRAGTTSAFSVNREVRDPSLVFASAKSISSTAPIYYFQNFGGGGVGVGLLLGPIGAAANAGMIASKTNDEAAALNGKLGVVPTDIAARALASRRGFRQVADSSGLVVSPYVMVVKGEGEMLHFATTLDVASGGWQGRYTYHLPMPLSLSSVTAGLDAQATAQLSQSLEQGFARAAALLEQDLNGGLVAQRDVTFYTESLSPRFKLPVFAKLVSENADTVVVLGPGGADQLAMILSSGYHEVSRNSAEISNR